MKRNILMLLLPLILVTTSITKSDKLFIPMDLAQTDHLKAYGIVYWWLEEGKAGDWLLNHRSGSFAFPYDEDLATECRLRGVDFEVMSDGQMNSIYQELQDENVNKDVVRLEKSPKIAVYAPPGAQPWDDAVRMVLEYAEIPHDIIWDEEVIDGKLKEYDWLHLHHEDFTGQYGKFWRNYSHAPWYISQVSTNENMANRLGYKKVSVMKKDVAFKIREYIAGGGFLFAMCSATDSYDIALATADVDICAEMFDGDPCDRHANEKLNYENTLAFKDFTLILDPNIYEFSDIDIDPVQARATKDSDYFTLFEFSAKYDPVPTMLTQCHANVIPGFMGQTTAFHKDKIKNSVIILGEREGTDHVRYIHGKFGSGFFTWYGGHDPEDYTHYIADPPTDVSLHKNSPGYRLILNNILFPAAKKKKQKT